jgi:nucleoside-diphosphate-sugar epimerase
MKVLVTGHDGYIGAILVPLLQRAGHEVVGLDSYWFEGCTFGESSQDVQSIRVDLRESKLDHLKGFDVVMHLAGISNDPMANLNPDCTFEINHRSSVRLAELAKQAGVERFIFSSSCSNYGAGGDGFLDESAAFNPVTAYGKSKVLVEQDVTGLADDSFSPTFLRNATAYGLSTKLRADLVINNLVGYAFTTGEVLIKSDGSPWRPLVHIEDISRAFLAVMEAPREKIHNEAFNVGRTEENYRIRDLAELVKQVVPGSTVKYAEGGSPDKRDYRVDCGKIASVLGEFKPTWTALKGMHELYEAYKAYGLTTEEFLSARYLRIKTIEGLMAKGMLDDDLRWKKKLETPVG